jgi:DNA polymerase III subunit gamma/tau
VSYQVIARKYRPRNFSELTGQEHIARTLSHALDAGRLHHAYLFSGVRGTGKTTTARILAKGLNCQTGVTSQPCLQCASCLEIAAGNSIDVLEIDAASNTGVDNVRDVIINNIATSPARDRYKVFVIDEVHMLSTSAFNALLKTLEEPPRHVIFIMATTELHKVPDTILSRCQQFEFRQIPSENIFKRLREIADLEDLRIGDSELREIARAGAGSLRDAQSALDQVIAFSGTEITEADVTAALGLVNAATLAQFAEAIAYQNSSMTLSLVEEVSSRGYDLRNLTRELMGYLRHLLVLKSGIASNEILPDIEIDRLKKLASHFSEEDLVRCFHLLAETEKEIKDSPHPRFQLEVGLIKIAHATRLRTLDELIKRLEAIESRISMGGSGGGAPALSRSSDNVESEEVDLSEPDRFSAEEPLPQATGIQDQPPPALTEGREVDAILQELQRINRGLLLTALEDAAKLEYQDGILITTFGKEDLLARRVRDSNTLFREIGERLFGKPMRVEVKISGQLEDRVDEAELKRRQLQERATQNPAARLILDQTRGEIIWVKEKQ